MTLISEKKISNKVFSFRIKAESDTPAVIVCLPEDAEYNFKTSGTVKQVGKGTYSITFKNSVEEKIEITKA